MLRKYKAPTAVCFLEVVVVFVCLFTLNKMLNFALSTNFIFQFVPGNWMSEIGKPTYFSKSSPANLYLHV